MISYWGSIALNIEVNAGDIRSVSIIIPYCIGKAITIATPSCVCVGNGAISIDSDCTFCGVSVNDDAGWFQISITINVIIQDINGN